MSMARPHPEAEPLSSQRRAPRYPINAPAEVNEPLGAAVSGWITVISETGCYMLVGHSFYVGAVLRLRIEHESQMLETWVRVASTMPEGMGLEFRDMEREQLAVLREWLL